MKSISLVLFRFRSALRDEGGILPVIKRSLHILNQKGLRFLLFGGMIPHGDDPYRAWAEGDDVLSDLEKRELKSKVAGLESRPKFSIILPTYNTSVAHLKAAVGSVERQLYDNWELCIADDASQDTALLSYLKFLSGEGKARVAFRSSNGHISAASNSALELASGDWIVPLDHDDLITEDALCRLALSISQNPTAKLFYSDEDKIDDEGRRFSPYFKPDFNYELLRGNNYICHLSCFRRDLLQQIGGYREGFEGAQDHDLLLRYIECCERHEVVHIPLILYHWRWHAGSTSAGVGNKDYASAAGTRAIKEHLERIGQPGEVEADGKGAYSIQYSSQAAPPSVQIIIPSKDNAALLGRCVQSVLDKTSYSNYTIAIIDNGSTDKATLALMRRLDGLPQVRVHADPRPFNYSRMNNEAVARSAADYVLLLNDDTAIISDNWLNDMVALAVRDDSGAVGAKLLYQDRIVQHAGVVVGIGAAAGHVGHGLPEQDPGHFFRSKISSEFSAVTAACLLVSREKFLEVGGMDEQRYRVAFNDIDFCLKLKRAGYVNYLCATAVLYHFESRTRGSDTHGEKFRRFHGEVARFRSDWYPFWLEDPAWNRHLSRDNGNFAQDYRCQWRAENRASYGNRVTMDTLANDFHEIALINSRAAQQTAKLLKSLYPLEDSEGSIILLGSSTFELGPILCDLRPAVSIYLSQDGSEFTLLYGNKVRSSSQEAGQRVISDFVPASDLIIYDGESTEAFRASARLKECAPLCVPLSPPGF